MSCQVLHRGEVHISRCYVPKGVVTRPVPLLSSSRTRDAFLASTPRHTSGIIHRCPRRRLNPRAESIVAHAAHATPKPHKLTLNVAGSEITLETGEIGRQANGAVMLTSGETVLYATACCGKVPTGDGFFVPFTVDYQERFSAIGRTSGGYIKREGRTRDADALVSRLVDRPLRPMFPKGWAVETQVLEYVLSYDGVHSPEPLAITAASAALLVSDIPLTKAVAGVRVGWLPGPNGGTMVINPTIEQMKSSHLDLMMAGTRDAVLMIEGYCTFLTDEKMLAAVAAGSAAITSMCEQLEDWAALIGKSKAARLATLLTPPPGLEEAVRDLIATSLEKAFRTVGDKDVLSSAVDAGRTVVLGALGGPDSKYTTSQLMLACKNLESEILRNVVLTEGRRSDGRGVRDIRPITSRAGFLPRCHGSALFTRGETQALCVTTLGGASDALRADNIRLNEGRDEQRFYLQYSFPPSSVGEVGRSGFPGRRELGHGELAQRALVPVVPDDTVKSWPYTMRVESTITESNGSSSMASVCGGCLALMDAGVPILRPVAGIAMGLILEPDGRFCILSDILGSEDALGDMDFKVAGDADFITAFQMDIKVEGITLEVMSKALAQAREGRRHILGEMAKCSPPPRAQLSDNAPFVHVTKVEPSRKAEVIGSGGKTVKLIVEMSGATAIHFDDNGDLEILAPNRASGMKALEFIELLVEDPKTGRIFRDCKVTGIQTFGAFVEIGPGRQGLVHVSELDIASVDEVSKVVKINDKIDVMVLDSGNGKISLSRRSVLLVDSGQSVTPRTKRVMTSAPSGSASSREDSDTRPMSDQTRSFGDSSDQERQYNRSTGPPQPSRGRDDPVPFGSNRFGNGSGGAVRTGGGSALGGERAPRSASPKWKQP